jgi:L-rhamnose mutarotase
MIKVVHGRLLCDHDQLVWLLEGSRENIWCNKKNICYLVDVEDVNKVMNCTNRTIFLGTSKLNLFLIFEQQKNNTSCKMLTNPPLKKSKTSNYCEVGALIANISK